MPKFKCDILGDFQTLCITERKYWGGDVLQDFQKLVKLTIFGIFDELLSTQNVNVARFARNVECDFFCGFQTLWYGNAKCESPAFRLESLKKWIKLNFRFQAHLAMCLAGLSKTNFHFGWRKFPNCKRTFSPRRRLIANIVALTSKQKTKWSKVEQKRYFGN